MCYCTMWKDLTLRVYQFQLVCSALGWSTQEIRAHDVVLLTRHSNQRVS
jgi:hypothetical protein